MEDTLDSLIAKVNAKLAAGSYFYVSNDPERATGLEDLLKNFHIVHIDKSQYLDDFQAKGIPYFCWQEHLVPGTDVYRSSLKVLKSPEFLEYFNAHKAQTNYFQTFKISPAFEKTVADLGGILMNTSAALNREFEDKLSQYRQLSQLAISLPKTVIMPLNSRSYTDLAGEFGQKFVVQFDRGHTGSGTVFITDIEQYEQLQQQFPEREVRLSELIAGNAYTLNACVLRRGVAIGGLNRQLTGIPELTPEAGGTVGNDWSYRRDLEKGLADIVKDVTTVGEHMREQGYLGLFGMDLIVMPGGGHKFIEINARQPASIPMYTRMQRLAGLVPLSLLHIVEFLGIDYQLDLAKYLEQALAPQEYSQIFVRALNDSVVNYELRSGYYRLQGDNAAIDRASQQVKPNTIFLDEERDKALLFYADGYAIDQVDTAGMVILTPVKGRMLKYNEEAGRLQLRQGAYTGSGTLKPWIIESLKAIRDYQL